MKWINLLGVIHAREAVVIKHEIKAETSLYSPLPFNKAFEPLA